MLTQKLKNKVATLWDKFWAGGISNPLNAIEQITYLLFIKQLDEMDKRKISDADYKGDNSKSIFSGKYFPPGVDEKDEKNAVEKETLRWSFFKNMPSDDMLLHIQSKVFPFIKQLDDANSFFTKHMANAAFLIPSGRMLTEAVKTIDDIYKELEKENRFIDAQGDFYEFLLDSLRSSGKNGQFRTPTHIIELITELVEPKLGHKIADPASGTAGFLLSAYKYIITEFTSDNYKQKDDNGFVRGTLADKLVDEQAKKILNEETFYGFDIDPTMIRIGLMNLMMHGITQPKIDYKDTLSKNYNEDNFYDVVMANPPFAGSMDKGDLNPSFTTSSTKSELLFLERIYKMLKMGGTAGVVVPQGVLFGSSKAFITVRKLLLDKCELKAVIAMPSGIFRPYAGVASAILIFTKSGETKDVWFYEMQGDGWSLDDKRNPKILSNGKRDFQDLHVIIDKYKKRNPKKEIDRTKQHFFVHKQEIIDNDYDLSLSKYKEEVYVEIKYDKPSKILSQLSDLEVEIENGINELKELF
ncbi:MULTISPECIES: type I restriction-modification system subunit M [Chryseobacterium]|uniref:site-specific DNA-methyltransferase (adenine-specific) n=1 Tax=Chryseobacterium pennipullorum TaxID=2258963 RepID=A0A3D9AZ72_9FLAO|nr:type I restriction-modification system subunit M [Chryseobacterium pennipullorum]REC46644.1 SAM-dependent DNA methyltransferase [Chryseobacterium pennipullorum]